MTRRVIVDTGPLVAFLDRAQTHHRWTTEESRRFEMPWLTCEAVVAEAWHLLRRSPAAQEAVLEMVRRGHVQFAIALGNEIEAVLALRRKYRDVPMSLADACLVRMSELFDGHHVVTFDSDFTIYRKRGREPLALVMPSG